MTVSTRSRLWLAFLLPLSLSWACGEEEPVVEARPTTVPVEQPPEGRTMTAEGECRVTKSAGEVVVAALSATPPPGLSADDRSGFYLKGRCTEPAMLNVTLYFAYEGRILRVSREDEVWRVDGSLAQATAAAAMGDGGLADDAGVDAEAESDTFVNGVGELQPGFRRRVRLSLVDGSGTRFDVRATVPWTGSYEARSCPAPRTQTTRARGCGDGSTSGSGGGGDWD